MGYLSIRQTSEKLNLSPRWINDLCSGGSIPGVKKIDSYRAIPFGAIKPTNSRVKSGHHRKNTAACEP